MKIGRRTKKLLNFCSSRRVSLMTYPKTKTIITYIQSRLKIVGMAELLPSMMQRGNITQKAYRINDTVVTTRELNFSALKLF